MSLKLNQRLSGSAASIICFSIAWLARVLLVKILYGFGSDRLAQVLIARNFLSGKGLSIGQTSIHDLAQQYYAPAIHNPPIGWPPGYSLMLSPFLMVIRDFSLASFLLDITIVFLFLIYLRKVLKLLKFPDFQVNLFLIYQGIVMWDYGSTDFSAATFLLIGLYCLARILVAEKLLMKEFIVMTVAFVISAMLRYQFQPICFIILVVAFLYGWRNNKVTVLKMTGAALLILTVVCTGWFLFQKFNDLEAVYFTPSNRGFFPTNLQWMNPFLISAFINTHFYTLQISHLLGQPYTSTHQFFRLLNLLLLVISFLICLKYLTRQRKLETASQALAVLLVLASVGVVGELVIVSLLYNVDVGPPLFKWTYVMSGRYYLLPMLGISIFAWYSLFVRTSVKSTMIKALRFLLEFVVAIEMVHGFYFIAKNSHSITEPISKTITKEPENAFLLTYIEKQDKNASQLVISSFLKRFAFLAQLNGTSALFNPLDLNEDIKASKPTRLIVVLRESEESFVAGFLRKPNVQRIGMVAGYTFYEYQVPLDQSPQ